MAHESTYMGESEVSEEVPEEVPEEVRP